MDEVVRVTLANTIHNDTIVAIEESRCKFSREDQKVDAVSRFQHVVGLPYNDAMMCYTMTNGIKNKAITNMDIK